MGLHKTGWLIETSKVLEGIVRIFEALQITFIKIYNLIEQQEYMLLFLSLEGPITISRIAINVLVCVHAYCAKGKSNIYCCSIELFILIEVICSAFNIHQIPELLTSLLQVIQLCVSQSFH